MQRKRTVQLTNRDAREFLLFHQGLQAEAAFIGKEGALSFIERVGCIQYDPLNIVGRNPELVLQSRIPNFKPPMLQELLYKDRMLLDGLDKVMSIYPAVDWPYFERYREEAKQYYGSMKAVTDALPAVREELSRRGPLSSDELKLDQKIDWAWAPTRLSRAVLESMYFWGELVVHHKRNNQKVYDFACRHLPEALLQAADPNPTATEYEDWRVLRRIGAVGLLWEKAGDAWIGTRLKAPERKEAFRRLWENGRIIRITVEGIDTPFYARTEDYERFESSKQSDPMLRNASKAFVLAPLDNLLWDRRLIAQIFGFEYIWEVYKPVQERKYGYYVLPILYGDTFIARFEPGRDKRTGALIIKNWWWEDGVRPSADMLVEIRACFDRFRSFIGTNILDIDPEVERREQLSGLRLS